MMMYNKDEKTGELCHYGIKGQKWGVRRYQNEDGTLTEEGKRRFSNNPRWEKKTAKRLYKYSGHTNNIKFAKKMVKSEYNRRSQNSAAAIGVGGAVAGSNIGGPAGFAVGLGTAAVAGGAIGLVNTLKAEKINRDFDIYYELNKSKGDDVVNDYKDTTILDIGDKKYKVSYKT